MNLTETALPDGGATMAEYGMFGLTGLPELVIRFGINLAVILILVRWLYTVLPAENSLYLSAHFKRGLSPLLYA